MSASWGNDLEDSISEINVVPLVDIILVVLIIFMVTAPMFLKPSINVNLPKAASGDSSTKTQFNVTLSKEGVIFLNGQKTDLTSLQSHSAEESKKNPDLQAVIAADRDVPHGQVVAVMDAVKSGGIKRFAISIDKK